MKITKFSIFVNGQNNKKEIAEMILLLTKNRVQRNQIRIYDVSEEKQIQLYFKQNNYSYPVLFLWGNIYGSLEYVKEQANEGYLQLALMNNPNKKGKKKGNNNTTDYEFNPVVKEEVVQEEKFENKIIIPKQKQPKITKKNKKPKKHSPENEKEVKEEEEEKVQKEIIVKEEDEMKEIETVKEEMIDINENIQIEKKEEIKENEITEEIKEEEKKEEDSFEESLIKITESQNEEDEEINEIIQQEEIIPILDMEVPDDENCNENTKEMVIIEDYECSEQIENEQYFELNVPQLNTLNLNDKWLNACEWVLRTLNPIKPKPIKEDPTYLQKKENDIDYYVTRTNWYWRHQIRIIRFTNECFYRLDEEYRIREKFEYENVSEIIQTDYEHVIIKFSSNSQDQYLQCKLCYQLIKTLVSHINVDNCKMKIIN